MGRAEYLYFFKIVHKRRVISITDLDGPVSVTNDMENVLADIIRLENKTRVNSIPLEECIVIYRDTDGNVDGYDVKTQTFYPVRKEGLEDAVMHCILREGGTGHFNGTIIDKDGNS